MFHTQDYTISSKGVQITGAGCPALAHTARTSSTIAAFAMWRQFQVSRNRPLASFRGLLQTLHHQRFIAALVDHLHGNLFSTWKSGCHTLLFTCRAAARPRGWKARKPARTHLTGANGDHGDGELSLCSLCLLLFKSGAGSIQESVRTPYRNQQEVTEATERKLPFPLRSLRLLLLILKRLACFAWFAVELSFPEPPRPTKRI